MKLFSEKHTTPDSIEISFKREQRGMWNPRVLVLYQGKWGSVDPLRRAVRFQGIPGGVACGSILGRIAANMEILESWRYARTSGAASILSGEPSDSREFQVV